MLSPYRILTEEQVQSFMDNGYLVVKNVLDLDIANQWIEDAFERLGYDPADESTWTKSLVWLNHQSQLPIRELAPKAWSAILDVVGGEERLETQVMGIESSHFTTLDYTHHIDQEYMDTRHSESGRFVICINYVYDSKGIISLQLTI